tara:strand:- start:185 stop:649 length:465 start_codon:yes stop_codon:yes gene_type:complete
MKKTENKALRDKFWEKYTLDEFNSWEWDALCDGCGKCCLLKLEDGDQIYLTNIACSQIDLSSCKCRNYEKRTELVKNCMSLNKDNLKIYLKWLPYTCSYKLVSEKKPLPPWHHLITKDRNTVHQLGFSIKNNCIHETKVEEKNARSYVIAKIST